VTLIQLRSRGFNWEIVRYNSSTIEI